MTDDRSLERAARSWLEEGPTRAPDQAIDAAFTRIRKTSQERDLRIPWRLPTMTPILRLGGVGLVVVLAVGVALFGLRPATIGPGTPTAAPTAQPSSSPPTASATDGARPIPNGTYQASVPVADILARLDADQSLTAADKTDVIDALLHIRGATTLHVEITIADETFTLGYAADSNPIEPNSPWRLYILDPSTIAVDIGTDSSGIQAYRVTKSGQSFTLRASSPAEAGETFVRSVLFETAQFSPKA
jgi:hypothetical protein